MDMILEGRMADAENVTRGADDGSTGSPRGTRPNTSGADAEAIATISEAVNQLRHDMHMSKVNLDHIQGQQLQQAELAQRLNIVIDDGEVGTTLSLNRVQVMVAAAARQLVAGSKWVTQDTFDYRFNEVKREVQGFMREVQAQIEDVTMTKQIVVNTARKLPNLAKPAGMAKTMTSFNELEDGWDSQEKAGSKQGKVKSSGMAGTAPAQIASVKAALQSEKQSRIHGVVPYPSGSARVANR